MNRRRFLGLLAAAPVAVAALGQVQLDPNLGPVPAGAQLGDFTAYANFSEHCKWLEDMAVADYRPSAQTFNDYADYVTFTDLDLKEEA